MMQTKKYVLSALLIAIGLVLPFFTAQIREVGMMLTPMHFPVIIGGFICGPAIGLLIGVTTPLLRSILFGMPMMFPSAVAMAFELGIYGFLSGFLYNKNGRIYSSLVIAMFFGRIGWGIVMAMIMGATHQPFTLQLFLSSAFLNSIPGIILQLFLIPLIVKRLLKLR